MTLNWSHDFQTDLHFAEHAGRTIEAEKDFPTGWVVKIYTQTSRYRYRNNFTHGAAKAHAEKAIDALIALEDGATDDHI